MIVLDSNVLSALMQVQQDRRVIVWLNRQPRLAIWTTALTIFEIRSGLEAMPPGARREHLQIAFARTMTDKLGHRVLPFDALAADVAGRLAARRRASGFNVEIRDTQIAGIVLAHGATLATRNGRDFRDLTTEIVNPWDEAG